MDWSQYRHHCTWLQTLRIREDTVVSSVFQLDVSMPLATVSFLLLFGFGTNCRLLSLCPLPSRPSSLDWRAPRRLRRQFRDIRPVFISHSSTFLSVWGTWIYCLLPALHAHLPCTTLLNSEECALSEKKKKNSSLPFVSLHSMERNGDVAEQKVENSITSSPALHLTLQNGLTKRRWPTRRVTESGPSVRVAMTDRLSATRTDCPLSLARRLGRHPISCANVFTDKMSKLHTSNTLRSHDHRLLQPATAPVSYSSFRPASEFEISKILFNCPNMQSDSDPFPTWLLKECVSVLISTITNVIDDFHGFHSHCTSGGVVVSCVAHKPRSTLKGRGGE